MLHAIYPTLKAQKHDNANDNHGAEIEIDAYSQQNDLNSSIIKTLKMEAAASIIDPKHENSPPKAHYVAAVTGEVAKDISTDTPTGSGDDKAQFDEGNAVPITSMKGKIDPKMCAAKLFGQQKASEESQVIEEEENLASNSDNESSCSSDSGSGGMEMLALGLAMYCDVGEVQALEEQQQASQNKSEEQTVESTAEVSLTGEPCVEAKSTSDVPQDQNNNSACGLSKTSFSGSSLDADFIPEPESNLRVTSVEFVPGQERHIIKSCVPETSQATLKERSIGFQNPLLDLKSEDYSQFKDTHDAKGRCTDHGDQQISDDKTNAKGDLGNSALLEERCNLQNEMSPNHTGDGDNITIGHAAGASMHKGDSGTENDVEVEEIQAFLDHILGRQLEVVRAEKMVESPGNASPTIKPVSITLKESDIDTSNSSSDLMESSKDTESDEQGDVSFDMPKQISKECLVASMEAAAKAPKDEQAAKIQAALEASGIARGMNSQELMEDPSQSPRGKAKYAGKKSPYVSDKSKKSSSKSKKKVRFKASTKRDTRERPQRPTLKYPSRPRWSPEEEYYADFPSPEERRYPPWVEAAPSWRSSRDKWERGPHYQRKKFGRSPPGYTRSPPVHVVSPPPQRIGRMRWAPPQPPPMMRRYSPPSHRGPQFKKRHSKNMYAYEEEAIYDDPWFDYYEYLPPPLPPAYRQVARGSHSRHSGVGRSRSPNFSHPSKTNENWRKGMHENRNSSASSGNSSATSPTTLPQGATGKELVPHKSKSDSGKSDESPRTSLYVGDLHFDVTEAMLFELFSDIGPLTSIRVCRDKFTRKSLGYGYVNYLNPEDAERAHRTLNFSTMKGREIRLMWAERDPSSRQSGVGNLFVKNLDRNITNKVLHNMFAPFGDISSCKVAFDERGLSRGYGFVHFMEEDASFNAILKMNGKMVNGRKLNVSRFRGRNQMQESDGYDYDYDDYDTVPVSGYPIFLPGTHPSARIPLHDEP